MTATYASIRQVTPGITATAAAGGALPSGSIWLSFQARSRGGRNLLATPVQVSYSAGQKIEIAIAPTARVLGEDIFEFVVSGSATNSQTAMRRLASWRSRDPKLIDTVFYPGEGTDRTLPHTIELSQAEHVKTAIADITVATVANLPISTNLVHGMIRFITATSQYVRYDSEASNGLYAATVGYWQLSSLNEWQTYLAATTDPGGCDFSLFDIDADQIISPPPYNPQGQEQEVPVLFWYSNGLAEDSGSILEAGTRLGVQISSNGENKSIAFDGRAIARIRGVVRRSDGSLDTSIPGAGTDISLAGERDGDLARLAKIETPVDLARGYALLIEFAFKFRAQELAGKGIIDGAQLRIVLFEEGQLGVPNDAVYSLVGDAIFSSGDRVRVLPKLVGGIRRLGGTGIIKRYPLPDNLGSRDLSGLLANTPDQRIVISGALAGDIAIRQPTDTVLGSEAVLAIVSTATGTYTPTDWTDPIAISGGSQAIQVTVNYPCTTGGLGTVRSDYPDPTIRSNAKGDFNPPKLRVFVRKDGGTVQEIDPVVVLPSTGQTFVITTLIGATSLGALPETPNPEFCLWDYDGISGTSISAASSLTAGIYEVAIAYDYDLDSNEVTAITHDPALGCIPLLSTTLGDAIASAGYWLPPSLNKAQARTRINLNNGAVFMILDQAVPYYFDAGSFAADDDFAVLRPDSIAIDEPGRIRRLITGGGGGGGAIAVSGVATGQMVGALGLTYP